MAKVKERSVHYLQIPKRRLQYYNAHSNSLHHDIPFLEKTNILRGLHAVSAAIDLGSNAICDSITDISEDLDRVVEARLHRRSNYHRRFPKPIGNSLSNSGKDSASFTKLLSSTDCEV